MGAPKPEGLRSGSPQARGGGLWGGSPQTCGGSPQLGALGSGSSPTRGTHNISYIEKIKRYLQEVWPVFFGSVFSRCSAKFCPQTML